jgi:hypothetical protein
MASKPDIAYAAAVARQIVERVEPIKMVDPKIRNCFGRSESNIYRNPSPAVLIET